MGHCPTYSNQAETQVPTVPTCDREGHIRSVMYLAKWGERHQGDGTPHLLTVTSQTEAKLASDHNLQEGYFIFLFPHVKGPYCQKRFLKAVWEANMLTQ